MTNRKHSLPKEIEIAIEPILKDGREAYKAGRFQDVIVGIEAVWNMIPEPRFQWDFYPQTLSRTAVEVCVLAKNFPKSKHWLNQARLAYEDDGTDPSLQFLEAKICFELDDLERAFQLFDSLYNQYKKRPFSDEDPKYLNFYLKKKKS